MAREDNVRDIWTAGYETGYRHAQEVTAERKSVDPEHAAPTYVSSTSNRVYLLSEMPSRYIRNVLNMDFYRRQLGLSAALEAEMRRRGEKV